VPGFRGHGIFEQSGSTTGFRGIKLYVKEYVTNPSVAIYPIGTVYVRCIVAFSAGTGVRGVKLTESTVKRVSTPQSRIVGLTAKRLNRRDIMVLVSKRLEPKCKFFWT